MASVLTEHVRLFNSASDPVEQVLPELKKLLRDRMRRRNLLTAPPSYLGYQAKTWDSEGAFEDIVQDCYLFAILERMERLRWKLQFQGNVDGLVVLNVDHFLTQRQRQCDRIGYAVFGNIKGAAQRCEASGELQVEGRTKGRIHNSTVLRLDPSKLDVQAVQAQHLEAALEQVADWEGALPALVANTEAGEEWVAAFLRTLLKGGTAAVRCGDLSGVLATRARSSWASRHAVPKSETAREGDAEFGDLVRIVDPDRGVEERERWEKLKMSVPACIDRLNRQQRVKERLTQVFMAVVGMIDEGDCAPPKQAEVIDRLGIPRATVSDDFRLLKGILEELLREESPET